MMQAVALDLDDTLYLERDFVRSGFHAVGDLLRQRFGARCDWFAELWRGFEDGVRGDAFNRVLATAGATASEELIAELVTCYREHRPTIGLCDDVSEALDALDMPPQRLGVITDGPVIMQQNKFEALGLAKRVAHLICTDAWGVAFLKPHPRAFEAFEERTGFSGDQCAYVSDNPAKDFRSPHAHGWVTVRVIRSGGLHASETSAPGEVDHEVADLARLASILGGKEN